MKIGLIGPSYEERSLPFDAQRSVNFYISVDPQGKEQAALYGTPGLSLFATAGSGPVRGAFSSANGRAFVVSGANLYELSSAGVATSLGTLVGSSGVVYMDENPTQLFICDGAEGYTLTYSTNTFAQVTDADFPIAGTMTFLDSYFIVNSVNTGRFYISAVNDGTSWGALNYANAESSPDSLKRVLNAVGQLWLFGDKTTEIWTNTGDSTFPFQRISGAKMEVGIMSPASAVAVDNSVFWVGQDNYGSGSVYRAKGFSPQQISTPPITRKLQDATDKENIRGFSYQEDGHVFYMITGGGLETSLCYDLVTQQWHERAYTNNSGVFEQHRGCCAMYAFDKTLVGDRENGNIYEMSLEYYSDAGDALVSERTFTHLSDEGKRIRYNALELGFETGVGLQSGQGSNPVVSMQLSKDGAKTWSDWHDAAIGAAGAYQTKVMFRRLGVAEQMTFKIRVSDPVKRAIIGAYLT